MSNHSCLLCGGEASPSSDRKTADGDLICWLCYSRLPRSIGMNLEEFHSSELIEIEDCLVPECNEPELAHLFGIRVMKDSLQINECVYKMQALASIEMKFWPTERLARNAVIVTPYVVIELRKPHMLLQEPLTGFFNILLVECKEKDGHVIYTAPAEEKFIESISNALRNHEPDFTHIDFGNFSTERN